MDASLLQLLHRGLLDIVFGADRIEHQTDVDAACGSIDERADERALGIVPVSKM